MTIATIFGFLSLAATGFRFGSIDSIFHLPIIGMLYDDPQFASDLFIQSVRRFSAGPWLLMEGADRYMPPYPLLLSLAFLSRTLIFIGFLSCASHLGVRSRSQRGLFAALLATTGLMKGVSAAGGGALFVPDFSHTEFANGFLLLTVYYAVRGRLDGTLAALGATFFCNAFMGVWTIVPVLVIFGLRVRRGDVTIRNALRQGIPGLAVALALAAPVVANVLQNPDFGLSPPLDYRTFLSFYWPQHFLFQSIPLTDALRLALIVVLAALSIRELGRRAAPFQTALAGFCVVYALGVAAPLVTDSPAILNLHLLRVGAALHMLAALAALSLATRWATGDDPWRARVAAPVLVLSLLLEETVGFAPVLIYVLQSPQVRLATAFAGARPWFRAVACIGVAAVFARHVRASSLEDATFDASVAEWSTVGAWAKESTPVDAIFLTPTYELQRPPQPGEPEAAFAWAAYTAGVFEYAARRRVWVDFKRGAAVMWAPSYYTQWRTRIDEVLGLRSLPDRRAYAAKNGTGYVVDICPPPGGAAAIFRTEHLCVFEAVTTPPADRR